jgi:hypothetical protein
MNYAIIGFGAVGQALARAFARKGIEVAVASTRPPEALTPVVREIGRTIIPKSLQDALKAEIVILAVPFWQHPQVLGDASQHGGVVHPEALGRGSDRAPTRDGKKVANVIPVDHNGAILHREGRYLKIPSNNISYVGTRGGDFNSVAYERRTPPAAADVSSSAGSISHHRYANSRTERLT